MGSLVSFAVAGQSSFDAPIYDETTLGGGPLSTGLFSKWPFPFGGSLPLLPLSPSLSLTPCLWLSAAVRRRDEEEIGAGSASVLAREQGASGVAGRLE